MQQIESGTPSVPVLLTETQVRQRFNLSRSTMWRWRRDGIGPKCYHLGPRVMYAERDLVEWLELRRAG
jgi:predicted DNA-binding transcriptional regulator AlpA